jgi:hypothetical protein
MPTLENDPAVGDFVIVRGQIKSIIDGVALIEVYRGYPVGANVAVQCGALDLAEPADSTAVGAGSEEDRIRDMMAEAQAHPGRMVTR